MVTVYAALAAQASAVVRAEYGAIAGAVYARPADRTVIERVPLAAGVSFTGLWLDASDPVLTSKAESRMDAPVVPRQRGCNCVGTAGVQP
jgi:predicted kinase